MQYQFRYRPVHLEVLDGAAEDALESGDQDGADNRGKAGGEQQPAEIDEQGVGSHMGDRCRFQRDWQGRAQGGSSICARPASGC